MFHLSQAQYILSHYNKYPFPKGAVAIFARLVMRVCLLLGTKQDSTLLINAVMQGWDSHWRTVFASCWAPQTKEGPCKQEWFKLQLVLLGNCFQCITCCLKMHVKCYA